MAEVLSMADTQEESSDSRTSFIGRKRDFQDSLQYRESVTAESSDDERSRKRVKGAHVPSNTESAGDDLPINASYSPSQQFPEVDVDGLFRGETGHATQSVLEFTEERSGASPSHAEVQGEALPATWNQGVQSGLRTSFGSKSRSRRAPSKPENNRQSTLPPATQLTIPVQLGHPQDLLQHPRSSGDENDALMGGGKSSRSNQPVQVENVPAFPAQIEALSKEKGSGHQEAQAPISVSQSLHEVGRLEPTKVAETRGEFRQSESSFSEDSDSNGIVNPGSPATRFQPVSLHSKFTRLGKDALKRLSIPERKAYWESFAAHEADLRQSELSSSEDSDSEGEESHSNGIVNSGVSSTRIHLISTHSKFTKLSKNALKRLPIPERQAYDEAHAAHEAEKRLRSMRNGGKPKKLTDAKLDLLDPQKRNEYLAVFKEAVVNKKEKERSLLEEATHAATVLLAEGCRPPFPKHCEIATKIAQGSTFYPRDCKPMYGNRFGAFKIFEVLDQGKPIHIAQFSFNVFAPAFLANNRDKWNVITQRILVSAFSIYITSFYSHVMGYAEWLRSTATADDALTVEEAKHRVQMGKSADSNTLDGAFAASGDDGQLLDRGKATSLPLLSAEVIKNPEKDDTGNLALDALRPPDTTASLDLFDNGIVGSLVNNGSDHHGESHTNGRTSESDMGQTPPNNDDQIMADAVQMEVTNLTGGSEPLPEVESMDFDIDEAELFLQQKYFPSGTTSTRRCLSCGQVGHNSSTCPALSCTSCGSFGKHSVASCPLNVRCGKCRERGHSMQDCPEKLARLKGEAVACDVCGSKDHLEIACHYIWRSYEPKPAEIHRVRDIPVYCYRCGAVDHYGPECGLHRGCILSGGNTWSRNNLLKYLDPASPERALSAGVDYSIPGRSNKQFSIKGKANDPIPIDDSDDENFIRAKIKPPIQNGPIRFGRSNEDYLPRRAYENAPPRSHGPDSMQDALTDMSYYPGQPAPEPNSYRLSGPPQGMLPLSMRGPNNGGGGKKGPNLKRGGPAEPGKKKRARITKADRARMQNEGKARKRG